MQQYTQTSKQPSKQTNQIFLHTRIQNSKQIKSIPSHSKQKTTQTKLKKRQEKKHTHTNT